MAQFVDRIERGMLRKLDAKRRVEDEKYNAVKATIPEAAFNLELVDLPFSTRLYDLLLNEGYKTAGDLMLQMALESDEILKISGVGPRALDEIKSIISTLEFPEPIVEEISEESEINILEEPTEDQGEIAEIEVLEDSLPETTQEEEFFEEQLPESDLTSQVETTLENDVDEIVAGELLEAVQTEPEEQEESLEDLFKLRPETFGDQLEEFVGDIEEDEDEESSPKKGKKAKKKKRRNVEMEYDPDLDIMVVKRKRKRTGDWDDNWEL